jgi:hypothetical protein
VLVAVGVEDRFLYLLIGCDGCGQLRGAAVRGEGPWLVVVTGPSKVGKSRTLFRNG